MSIVFAFLQEFSLTAPACWFYGIGGWQGGKTMGTCLDLRRFELKMRVAALKTGLLRYGQGGIERTRAIQGRQDALILQTKAAMLRV
jgi:hypothetical protein